MTTSTPSTAPSTAPSTTPSTTPSTAPSTTVGRYARLVALPHTIFALPFALGAAALAWKTHAITFSLMRLGLIVVAVAAARTAAMAFNRVVDHEFDAANPRTQGRELPRGAVSRPGAIAVVIASCAVFVVTAALLGRWPLILAPVALAILLGYSLAKRFTWATHLWLGLALAGAPMGAWIAITNDFGWAPLAIGLSVMGWVAGFDIIYSCQDQAFDRARGLGSIPARFGIARALTLSRALHTFAVVGLITFGILLHLSLIYFAGVAVIAVTLVYEQRLVSPTDLSRVDKAFFDLNGYVSLAFAIAAIVEALR
jgi:4-hydroxybenzoate polyprenyltransferase